ncbi:2457_t:CDS:2 [Entrophospora sp. SA101]|nr:3483_t:CDS:2 [Entrophospora sp. SA101]CAJ0753886.1 20203_t:CDS:2 [Entrophospora sp. SA101]CAJ0759121.1 2457_t:CDS:2 [Entrophospora sp. SA101]CAJ0841399.1 1069_t:CDS:2 [Entrophospora sp. SA101]CAJ0907036.1 13887_t:CDS:2 [Entrophospora sp. SA101]
MFQQQQTIGEQLSQQSQRQQNYYDNGEFEHSVQQLIQQQRLQQPIQNLGQQFQQQNYDRQLQNHVQQNLQQNFGQIQQINNPNQQMLQQQIQETQQTQNIDHRVIAFDNSLSFQKMTNDNTIITCWQRNLCRHYNYRDLNLNVSLFNPRNNNDEGSLIAAISHHMLIIKDYRMKINQHHFELEQIVNMLRRWDDNRDVNLNVSSFNPRNNNDEDSLIAAISHHMLIIKDYRMKINQHHFELEQIVNMLRRWDNNRDSNLNVSTFNFRNNIEEDSLIAAISHHMLIIKDYRMKINQHHFELEQVVNILRRRDNSRDLNLNFSSFNSRNNNRDSLIAAIFHHMLIIKDYRMKINQHHFELEQVVNMLRLRYS